MEIRKLTILSFLVALTVALEQVMQFLPNIQLTTLLIVLISTKFDRKSIVLAIITYVLLDNILGGFGVHTPSMFVAWIGFSLLIHYLKDKNEFVLAIVSLVFAIIYAVLLAIPTILLLKVDPLVYLMADSPFTAIFMLVNFLTVLWLFQPLAKMFDVIQTEIYDIHK